MEKITHEFKAGDWIDMGPLSQEQKIAVVISAKGACSLPPENKFSELKSVMVVGVDRISFMEKGKRLSPDRSGLTWAQLTAPLEDKPFTHDMIRDWLNGDKFTGAVDARMSELQEAVSKFDLEEIETMDWLENKKPKGGFVSKAVTVGLNELSSIPNVAGHAVERHDQEIDSGDGYDDALSNIKQGLCEGAMKKAPIGYQDDKPYTPQVGEECEFQSFIGNDWIKGVLLASTESYAILKSDQREHSFNKENVNFRPLIKTERDILVERACKELTAHFTSEIPDEDKQIVEVLVALGWRPEGVTRNQFEEMVKEGL